MKLGRVLALYGMTMPVLAQYGGPAILSRGQAPAAMSTAQIDFRPYVGLYSTYSTGLANVAVDNEGALANEFSWGTTLSWGISGTHSWRHTKLGLNYGGSIAHYYRQTGFDGIDQSFLLGLTHQLTRHWQFSWNNNIGTFSRDHGTPTLTATVPFDPSTTYVPTTDFFDNRTTYLSSQADVVYQKSARLSFDFGGDYFTTGRRSQALHGVTGEGARGDVQYRVSRRSTIGAQYNYQHFVFSKIFGSTDLHGVGMSYALQLTRLVEFSALFGIYRVENSFIEEVPLDPVIASLLGISSATRVSHTINYTPNISGRISRAFSKGVAFAAGGRSVTPGNGLFLTSISSNVMAGYSYTGMRRWSLNVAYDYSRSQALGTIQGGYTTMSGSASASRQLGRMVHLVFDYSMRKYGSPTYVQYNRLIHSASVGLAFAPGEVPLRVW